MSDGNVVHGSIHRISRSRSKPLTDAPLVAFEYGTTKDAPSNSTIIFLGGLGDGLLTSKYVPTLAYRLPAHWRLIEPLLSTDYRQWGVSSLRDDVAEIVDLIQYFQQAEGKIVLLGHSTGCQMIFHYLLSPLQPNESDRPSVAGVILQGSVSDREALLMLMSKEEYEEVCGAAQAYVDAGRGQDVLPMKYSKKIFGGVTPVNADRMLSITSPGPEHIGEDDYFSSDFDDDRLKRTFGGLGAKHVRIAILLGQNDEFSPLDENGKIKLIDRWSKHLSGGGAVVDEVTGLVEGGTHTFKEGGLPVESLIARIKEFLSRT